MKQLCFQWRLIDTLSAIRTILRANLLFCTIQFTATVPSSNGRERSAVGKIGVGLPAPKIFAYRSFGSPDIPHGNPLTL
jgi:hypothetical protein